jgi:hypothetical protein
MSKLTKAHIEQYLDRLTSWFDDQLGLDRKKLRKGEVTAEELAFLRSKSKVKGQVREGLLGMMKSRFKKGLGTYDVDNHILLNNLAFDRLYKTLQVDVSRGTANAPGQTYLPRRELWHTSKGRGYYMETVRYPKGHKFGGRIIKAYKVAQE